MGRVLYHESININIDIEQKTHALQFF